MMRVNSLKILAIALLMWPNGARAEDPEEGPVHESVVKIFATQRQPDLVRPWRKEDPEEFSGTGVVIEGKRILTNAHVVSYASRLFVQGDQSGDRMAATIEALAPDIDLAVLKLKDPTFFDKHPPLARASALPEIKDTVLVYGYPQGGQSLSITKGIVSRIEFDEYYYGTMGLRVQVDAAINPGNSGGPALVNNRVVGIASSRLQESDNIGYIIPTEEIETFLADVADGKYDGKPTFWDQFQTLENEALRAQLKLAKDQTGVMVWEPYRTDASYPLRPWDVVTEIGGHAIDNSGMVRIKNNLRLGFRYFIQKEARGNAIRLGIIRNGRRLDVDLPLSPRRERLIPFLLGKYPSYFVWGPMVFSPLTDDFIEQFEDKGWTETWFPYLSDHRSPLLTRRTDRPSFEGEELVVVTSEFLPHPIAKGYENPFARVVEKVNGVAVRNLRHLVELLRDATEDRIILTFVDKDTEVLVFDRREILEASEEIFAENSIRKPCSDDLKAVWEKVK